MYEENKNIQDRNIKAVICEWWRLVLLLSFLVVALVLIKVFGLVGSLMELQDWIKGLGAFGYMVFVSIHIGAMIAVIPRSVLAVTAGVFFGSIVGIILVSISAPIGAGLSFLIARYFARDATCRLLLRNEKINKLYQLTEEHGAIIVAISRLLFISPANLLNYGFGLTKVRFLPYIFWSFLTMLPATIVYVTGADTITQSISRSQTSWILVGSVIIALIIMVILGCYALRKFKEKKKLYNNNTYKNIEGISAL